MSIEDRTIMQAAASGEAARRLKTHIRVAEARHTTAGGGTTEDVTIAGVKASDLVFAFLNVEGATPRAIVKADYQAADTVRVTFDGDPSTDHVISVMAIRP